MNSKYNKIETVEYILAAVATVLGIAVVIWFAWYLIRFIMLVI